MAVTHLTLDGVMQAPGGLDEDTRDDLRYGGWSPPYGDAVMASSFGPGTRSDRSEDGGLLFGRRTYIQLHDAWRDRTANPFTGRLNAAQKYVASNTLTEPLPWENSTLITGDVPRAVTELKRKVLGDLVVIGSGMLLRSLMRHDLVDELLMTMHPLILGAGHRLFPSVGPRIPLKLTETKPTTTGVIIARYELEDAPTTPK